MKTLLLLLLPILSYAQVEQPNHLLSAGNYMLTGSALTVLGASTIAYGASTKDGKGELITVVGAGISGIGIIVYIMGINQIRVAGKELELTFKDGIGIAIKI